MEINFTLRAGLEQLRCTVYYMTKFLLAKYFLNDKREEQEKVNAEGLD
jgi:hypothetical protein